MNGLIHLPVMIQLQSENRICRGVELSVPNT